MLSRNFKLVVFSLFAITFLLKAFLLEDTPIYLDGTLYAEMIAEEADNITFLPKYLGSWTPWKPGLYFIAYSLFLPITSQLFSSIEWIYKSPNLLFGALNAFLFYLIAKRFLKPDVALVASLLFYCAYGVIYAETRLLMEVFALTPILLSLLFYTDKKMDPAKRFLCAGGFALIASLTKSVISFMLIPLALAYLFQEDRKSLSNPYFLISLLAPFIGMLLFYLSLESIGFTEEVLLNDTGKFFMYDYLSRTPYVLFTGFLFFFIMYGVYVLVSFRKMLSSWKEEIFFSLWLILALVPTLSGISIPWHTYYIAPSLAFFVALSLSHKGRIDSFSMLLVILLVAINLLMPIFAGFENSEIPDFKDARKVGLEFSGKENILIIGKYPGATTAVIYKILSERKETGKYLDFGYVALISRDDEEPDAYFEERLNAVVRDYYTQEYEFEDGNYALMFETNKSMRKQTNITEFEYILVYPQELQLTDSKYQLVRNTTAFAIYELLEEP